jgi:hypothetical protein
MQRMHFCNVVSKNQIIFPLSYIIAYGSFRVAALDLGELFEALGFIAAIAEQFGWGTSSACSAFNVCDGAIEHLRFGIVELLVGEVTRAFELVTARALDPVPSCFSN